MDNIEAAQSEDVFDVLAFIEATAYPTEEVVVFRDVVSATKYVELSNLPKIDEETQSKIEALGAKIKDSAMVFTLRGMPPGIVQEIVGLKEGEDENDIKLQEAKDNDLVAKSIIGVKNAKGTSDPRPLWEKEDVAKLRTFLKEGEFGKLLEGTAKVNFNAMVFDQATDAGFSGRSLDVE